MQKELYCFLKNKMSLETYLTETLHWSLASLTSLLSEAESAGISPVLELYRRELDKNEVLDIISNAYNLPIVTLDKYTLNRDLTTAFGIQDCMNNHVIFGEIDGQTTAILADPSSDELLERIHEIGIASLAVCYRPDMLDFESKYIKPLQVSALSNTLHMENTALAERINLTATSDDSTIKNIVSYLVNMAYDAGASDIQIIPSVTKASVYFRIDGKRQHIIEIDTAVLLPLHRVLGSMAKCQTDDTRRIIQGKIDFTVSSNQSLEVRLNIIPTRLGSSINMRLHLNHAIDLAAITDNQNLYTTLLDVTKLSDGLVLFCGPTGAGKSTTMAALSRILLKRDINICSVEDPVEQVIPGINQVDVNVAKELTYASVTRSFLRHDPDALIIGEIRDPETAEVVIQAADTGHLVLSTLHTKSAVTAISRLINLGVDRVALAENLAAVVCQRLVRRVCPHCGKLVHVKATDKRLAFMNASNREDTECMEAVGCIECNNTGYLGRIAICEVLVISNDLKFAIEQGKSTEELLKILKQHNFSTFLDDGYRQVINKVTTLEELQPFITTENLHGGMI